jgi:hypothetical protein
MIVTSFDIGIVNMAYCTMDYDTKKILHWEVFSLCNSSDIENCKDLVRKMDQRAHILEKTNLFILERQPKVNAKMRNMSSALKSYLIVRGLVDKGYKFGIKDYSPKHKLKCWDGPIPKITVKSDYQRRKKLAVFHCEKLIGLHQSEEIQEIYNKAQSKKDDLADCFLQCLSYIMYASKGQNNIINKIKPTNKQVKYSKYTKQNLKYLIDEYLRIRDESKPTEEESYTVDEVIDKYFFDNPRIKRNVDKHYGTDYHKMREEIIAPAWYNTKFGPEDVSKLKKVKAAKKTRTEEGTRRGI